MRYTSSIFFSVMVLGLLVFVQPTFAEETEPATSTTSTEAQAETSAQEAEATAAVEALVSEVEALATEAAAVEPTYEGIEIEKPTKAPGRFGSFWRNVKEQVSLAVTFDENKKAEKAMKFAEERMLIAEKMISENTDEPSKVQAQKHLEKAKVMLQKMQEHQQKALEKPTEETGRMLKNSAAQFERQKEIFDRLEEKSDDEALETVLKFREEVVGQGKALENAVNNENISDGVREHLKEVRSRIVEHAGEIKQRVAEFQELKAAAEAGDETAVNKLEAFKEERKKEVRERMGDQQEKMQKFEEKMLKIRDAAEDGDEQAQMMFEKMQDRPEFQETFEDLKGEFEARFDDERNEGKLINGDRRGPPPGFKDGPEGQQGDENQFEKSFEGQGQEGRKLLPGFFSKFKGFLNRDDSENRPPEDVAQDTPNGEPNEKNRTNGKNRPEFKDFKGQPDFEDQSENNGQKSEGQDQKPEGSFNAQDKSEFMKPGFFKGMKNFLDRRSEQGEQNGENENREFKGEGQPNSKAFEQKNVSPSDRVKFNERKESQLDRKGPEGNREFNPEKNIGDKPDGFKGGLVGEKPQGGFGGGGQPQEGFKNGGPQGGNFGGGQQGGQFGNGGSGGGSFSPPSQGGPSGEGFKGGGPSGGAPSGNGSPAAGGPGPQN